MPGGLIEIATYGSQDLFLTGTPEITFFKVIYRRNTNFSSESVRIQFDDPVDFGNSCVVKIPQVGDLMYKTYLEAILPEINLLRQTLPTDNQVADTKSALEDATNNYDIITSFMTINQTAYVSAYQIFTAQNNLDNTSTDMIQNIVNVFSQPGNSSIADSAKGLITLTPGAPFTYNEISMDSIASLFTATSDASDINDALMVGIEKSIKTQKYYYDILIDYSNQLADLQNPNIKFAWVDRIGHALIDMVEVRIGGQKIDRHYGIWMNIWYELTANKNMENVYFKMIGNVPTLTNLDRTIKPRYLLKIPLQFWFCRYSGLALPLVSLQYHSVSLHFNFRKFEELCYIESGTTIKYGNITDGIELDEVPNETGISLNASLLIDYIYLDVPERRRFAQSSHEYLIEQIQTLQKPNVIQQTSQFQVNNFVHPSKELIWVAQRSSFLQNNFGINKCRWDNYSTTTDNKTNAIAYSSIDFNSYSRVINLPGNYFNYLQPYEAHRATPSDGINVYSFAIYPEESQPSGAANLSRLQRINITMQFDDDLVSDNILYDPLVVTIFTRNVNILRFASGFSGIAWSYG